MRNKTSFILFPIFAILSAIFLYFFSISTSPLYHYWGFDSAIFMVVGKSMVAGRKLYTEIFDHKGPILFFIEYIGWKIGGVKGIFTLQVINLTAVLFITHKIAQEFKCPAKTTFIFIGGIFSFLCFTNLEGNQSEEYCLPFLFISTYCAIKYTLISNESKHPPLYALLYGICFTLIAFNRITNAGPIGGIVLGIIIYLLIAKEWKNLLSNAIFFILGIVSTATLISAYFIYNHSLYDMLYGTFIFNYKYSQFVSSGHLLESLFIISRKNFIFFTIKVTPILLLLASSLFIHIKKRNLKLLLISWGIGICTYIAINMGLVSYHYITISTIPLTIGLILTYRIIFDKITPNKLIKTVCSIYVILMFAIFIFEGRGVIRIYKESNSDSLAPSEFRHYIDKQLVLKEIVPEERNSVFGYNLPPAWYLETDMIPPFKYFTNQETWIKSDSLIYFEISSYLKNTPPRWIVIPGYNIVPWVKGVDSNPVLKELIKKRYILKATDINHQYYRRKDD